MTTLEDFVILFEKKRGKNTQNKIKEEEFYDIIHELIPSKTSEECQEIFTKLDHNQSKEIDFYTIINNDEFLSFLKKLPVINPLDNDSSDDSFVPNDNFQFDDNHDEKQKTHMLSYQDIQILQNQLRQLFEKENDDESIDFTQFCQIMKNVVPSPETNDNIKSLFRQLDPQKTGKISYIAFLQRDIFTKFLQSLNFVILDKAKTIQIEPLTEQDTNLFFRALSIHNAHDREIILSEAETINQLNHWINKYGKPAQLKCQTLQIKLDESALIIDSLQRQVNELNVELFQMKQENEHYLHQTTELREHAGSLEEQVSLVHEEMEQQKQFLSLTDSNSQQRDNELAELKLKFTQSVTTKQTLKVENDQLKEIHLQNIDENINIKKQLREKDLFIKSLEIDKLNLQQKIEKLDGLIQQQQVDINLLESETVEQRQEIELLRNKIMETEGNNDAKPSVGVRFRRSDADAFPMALSPTGMKGGHDVDTILDITTTKFGHDRGDSFQGFGSPETVSAIHDNVLAIHDVVASDDENDENDEEEEINYQLLHQRSMDVVNDYKAQIIELKQQLFDEQRRREDLEQEIQLKMEQQLKESSIRRNARFNDDNHGDVVALIVKDNSDESSPDELQPFMEDDNNNQHQLNEKYHVNEFDLDGNTVQKPNCCQRFLFGIC